MTIHDMVEGKRYFYGDSFGFDKGICIKGPRRINFCGSFGIGVTVLNDKSEECFLFESDTPHAPVTYVEQLN